MAKKDSDNIKSSIKGLGFCGVMSNANMCIIDSKDGKIVRTRPLHYDWKYKNEELPHWQLEARGQIFKTIPKSLIPPFSLAYKKRATSPNRILYPLKRVDWDPNGERNTQNRGISKYVRISWDEATSIISSEIKRVQSTYGPEAVLAQADGHAETKTVHAAHGCQRYLLNLLGGYTFQQRNPDSWEGWYWGAEHVWGCTPLGKMMPYTNVFPDAAEHTELMLFWGCDPETTTWGWGGQLASKLCFWFTQLGIKQIYICPEVNYGAAVHADKWIPILPNTDAALRLAIAYVWITTGTYDKDYIATHSVGFDKFKDYVLGVEDGVCKTPTWASAKCGVPSRTIKALAREWARRTTSIAHSNGGCAIRGPFSHEAARLEVYLLAMQGVGKPGVHQISFIEWGLFQLETGYPLPAAIEKIDTSAAAQGDLPIPIAVIKGLAKEEEVKLLPYPKQIIPKTLIHDAILNPPLKWYGNGSAGEPAHNQFVKYEYPVKGCPEIHMIWTDTPCLTTCWNDSNSTTRAYRSPKIEFMLAQHPWLENDCLFADIILPVTTTFENKDISQDTFSGQFHSLMVEDQCIQPVGEARSDYEVVCAIADKMGLLKEYTKGNSVDDWIQLGYRSSGVAHLVSWKELNEKKYWTCPINPKWKENKAGLGHFYKNPKKYPLNTPSGKIEFYSESLAQHFPDDQERPPSAQWVEKSESHDERISSDRTAKYPLLMMSNHGRWRLHAQLDDISWFHEVETCKVRGPDGYLYEPVWLNPKEAEKRGIKKGDIVKVHNERGAVLCGAYITERLMPGVAYVDHGSRYDPIVVGELDRGGAINTISSHNCTSKNTIGMAVGAFLVEVEPVNLNDLRMKYPEAFARPYDQASGLKFERALAKNK